jgi:hypothetical protein
MFDRLGLHVYPNSVEVVLPGTRIDVELLSAFTGLEIPVLPQIE